MNYAEYKFAQLLCVYDDEFKNAPYDDQFFTAMRLYNEFKASEYNHTSKAEYDCMCDYLSANQHKKVKLGDEIVESLKQFDGINAEVWNYVSEKLGYALQDKYDVLHEQLDAEYTKELEHRLDMVRDDLNQLRKFICDKGIVKYFQDSDDAEEGYVYLNNIDVACDLKSDESISWKLYKIITD